jgi:translation initiation factor 5A
MDDDFLSLMDDSGETREDLKCPDGEIGDQVRAAIDGEADILVSNYYHRCFQYHLARSK